MSLLHATLKLGRGFTQSRFTETVVVGRYEDSTDEITGNPIRTLVGTPSYAGVAQVKYPSLTVSESDKTSQPVAEQNIVIKFPSGTVLHVGEETDVIASTVDDSLVGSRYSISGQPQKGQTTSARYPVTELS